MPKHPTKLAIAPNESEVLITCPLPFSPVVLDDAYQSLMLLPEEMMKALYFQARRRTAHLAFMIAAKVAP